MTQQMRERVLKRFREGSVEVLVATDVAARGLDIDEIDIVFNYDLPTDPEDYVHRIGRTGRAGRSGRAVSFVYGREIYRLQTIERYTRSVIRRERIPSVEQVEGRRADLIFDELKERLESGKFDAYQDNIDRLLEQGHTPTDIAGALVTLLREASGREGSLIEEDREPERPARREKSRDDRAAARRRAATTAAPRPAARQPLRTRPDPAGTRHDPPVPLARQNPRRDGQGNRRHALPRGRPARRLPRPHHPVSQTLARRCAGELVGQVMERTRNARLRGRPFRIDVDRGPA